MASIRSIISCAILAIAITIAVPVSKPEPGMIGVHRIVLPSENPSTLIKPIDDRKPHPIERRNFIEFANIVHTKVLDFLFDHTYLRAHLAHDPDGQLADYPKALLNSTKVRRQTSVAGRLTVGAAQGLVTAGTALAGDEIADELTGNDVDHPQETKEQLEEDEDEEDDKEIERDEEETEGEELTSNMTR